MVFYKNTPLVCGLRSTLVSGRRKSYPAGEGLAALGADERCGDEVGVVVAFEVHVEQLLLSERLLTLAAGIRFLSSMSAPVHHHVALLGTTAKVHSHTLHSNYQHCTVFLLKVTQLKLCCVQQIILVLLSNVVVVLISV